jgi:hypothetical protein
MRSAPKKGASRCGGSGESMNDEVICSCTVTIRDRHGLCSGDFIINAAEHDKDSFAYSNYTSTNQCADNRWRSRTKN